MTFQNNFKVGAQKLNNNDFFIKKVFTNIIHAKTVL